jgi:hypothetical protein
MMPLSKQQGRSSRSKSRKTGRRNRRKTKPVKLPKTLRIMTARGSTNQVTRVSVLNITKNRIKNNTTVMISKLASGHKVHGYMRHKRNINDMERVR